MRPFSHRLLILAALALLPIGCSDAPAGGSDAGANGGTTEPCKGAFCLEEDRRIDTDPKKLDFVDIAPGEHQDLELVVQHIGNTGLLRLTKATFSPDADGEFSVVDFKAAELKSLEGVTWKIRYAPKKGGTKLLNLVISNNASKPEDREFKVPVVVKPNSGALKVSPDPINFGPVASKTTATKDVKLYNNGSKPLTLLSIQLATTGSKDFAIVKGPDLSQPIPPQLSADLQLSFTPTPGDADFTELVIEDADHAFTITQVYGAEIVPKIQVVPNVLKYGDVKVGDTGKRSFKIANQGLAPLKIEKLGVFDSNGAITVKLSEPGPLTLEPNDSKLIHVELTPNKSLPNDGSPPGRLTIKGNDTVTPQVIVGLFANTKTAHLKVTPPDVVDFAIVGEGLTVKRSVSVTNVGTASLSITKVKITSDPEGEFALVKAPLTGVPDFGPIDSPAKAVTIEGGLYNKFYVSFTAKGPVNAMATGELVIYSDAPNSKEWKLKLSAKRAKGASCNIQLIPSSLNYGVVAYGKSKALQLNIKNIGTGFCALDEKVKLLPCPTSGATLPGLPLPSGPPTCKPFGDIPFTEFALSPLLNKLGPGETGSLQIQFTGPKDLGGPFGLPIGVDELNAPVWYHGFVALKFRNTNQTAGSGKWYPSDPTGGGDATKIAKLKPNLKAGVGKSAVSVLPDSIDFGLVPVGCKSKVQTVRIYNNGTTPAFVTAAKLIGCGVEVEKVNWPGIPKQGIEVTPVTPVPFSLQYGPQNVGEDKCTLEITTGVNGTCADGSGDCQKSADCNSGAKCVGQTFSVPLRGEGTLDKERTDVFDQAVGNQVDVLFVIDNSGSMGDEQSNLATNFKAFIGVASLFTNTAYQVGVVTTDMKTASHKGQLHEHDATKKARIISPATTSDPTGVFQSLAKVGTKGSANEQGLAAAEAALTLPLVYDTGKKCTKDSDCAKGNECVMGGDGKKGCGGANRGFMRKNAGLEIVFVSDEEDSSTAPINYYANFLMSLKGAANKGKFHAHAIIGKPNDASCQVQEGKRYNAIAKQTGGIIASICSTSFAKDLKNIGTVAFGLSHQFFLKMVADPSTIKVAIGKKACPGAKASCGKVCAKGPKTWSYDEPSNSVIFVSKDNGGTCQPEKGDKVSIYYKVLCFP